MVDVNPNLLLDLPSERLVDALAMLHGAAEACPAPGMRDSRYVVSVMQQQSSIASDDEQHRRPSTFRRGVLRHPPMVLIDLRP